MWSNSCGSDLDESLDGDGRVVEGGTRIIAVPELSCESPRVPEGDAVVPLQQDVTEGAINDRKCFRPPEISRIGR